MADQSIGGDYVEVLVNKKIVTIPHDYTVLSLLEYLNYPKSVAVFINNKQILMAKYEHYKINQDDNVRIIKPLGGG